MVFLNKISLDGSFTLTTQLSTLKLSDHPDYFFFLSFFFFALRYQVKCSLPEEIFTLLHFSMMLYIWNTSQKLISGWYLLYIVEVNK